MSDNEHERQIRAYVVMQANPNPHIPRDMVQFILAQLDAARAEIDRLKKVAGLMANPAICEAVEDHIKEGYKNYVPDSCGSQTHKLYETSDCISGPSVVVEWSDKTVWFAPLGGGVEIDTYPKDNRLQADNAALRERNERVSNELFGARAGVEAMKDRIAELEEAAKPFGGLAAIWNHEQDDFCITTAVGKPWKHEFKNGDCRHLAAVLAKGAK